MEDQTLDKYQIKKVLGTGAFASVFHAIDKELEREVALKILLPLLLSDRVFVKQFYQEAKLASRLQHPNIVPIYEVGQGNARLFIAMGMASNGTLSQRLKEATAIPWRETIAIITGICSGLSFAHERGILHRDVKPSNILLHDTNPWLCDFGLARVTGTNEVSVSISGGLIGTPAYMAPELWENEKGSVQSDIYSLACTIYEMLTGRVLFAGSNPIQIMRAHDGGPQLDGSFPSDVPIDIREVLYKALNKVPSERHRTIDELLNDIQQVELRRISIPKQASYTTQTGMQGVDQPVEITLEEAFTGTQRTLQFSGADKQPQIIVKIPAGVDTGNRVRVANKGYLDPKTGNRSDLFLVITVLPHKQFERRGADLFVTVSVDLFTLILGGKASIPALPSGRGITLSIPPLTQNNRVFRLAGQGMPSVRKEEKGDLYVSVSVILPKKLSDQEIKLVEEWRDINSATS